MLSAMAVFIALIITLVGLIAARVYLIEDDAQAFIDMYRPRLTGSNRFLMNETILRQWFPHELKLILRLVWRNLVARGVVVRDQLDGEWCIK